jgi:hypothetical protein
MTDEEMKRLEGIAKEAERRNLITGETFPAWSEFLTLIERVRKAEARSEALRSRGAILANCAYNLKQNGRLPEVVRKSLEEAQQAWDATVREGP